MRVCKFKLCSAWFSSCPTLFLEENVRELLWGDGSWCCWGLGSRDLFLLLLFRSEEAKEGRIKRTKDLCALGFAAAGWGCPPQIKAFKLPPLQRFAVRKDDARDGHAVRKSDRNILQISLSGRFCVSKRGKKRMHFHSFPKLAGHAQEGKSSEFSL